MQHMTPDALRVLKEAIAKGDIEVSLRVLEHVKGRASQETKLTGGDTPIRIIIERVQPPVHAGTDAT